MDLHSHANVANIKVKIYIILIVRTKAFTPKIKYMLKVCNKTLNAMIACEKCRCGDIKVFLIMMEKQFYQDCKAVH